MNTNTPEITNKMLIRSWAKLLILVVILIGYVLSQ